MTFLLAEQLAHLPYFQSLDKAALLQITQQASRREFDPNTFIFLEGDAASGLWVIEKGRVKIYKINSNGTEHILHLLGTADTFNDIAALDGGVNPASAAALSAAIVWLIPSEVLQNLIQTRPDFAVSVIKMLSGRVRALVQQIESLALYSVTARLARFLLEQMENPSLSGPGITRAAIAAYLATQPETVSRALRTLEEAGAIRFDRHQIIITREEILKAIAAS
jgi:CRP/FNR family transcriptional regulator